MASENMSTDSSGSVDIDEVVAKTESCTWRVISRNGNECIVEPRTCQDCLNNALPTGEQCVLSPSGLCTANSTYDPLKDFTRPGSAYAFPVHENYFRSTDINYCEADDEGCKSCRDSTFLGWETHPSQFCYGADRSCVCVSICEAPEWEEQVLEPFLNTNTHPLNCTIDNSTLYLPLDDMEITYPPSPALNNYQKETYAFKNNCMFYQNSTYCNYPRSCYDCLNVPLYSGEECMINANGICTTMNDYDATLDYREVPFDPTANIARYFPSTNTTYCKPNDKQCQSCTKTPAFLAAGSGQVNPTTFCTGENECVCIAFCESPIWSSVVREATCQEIPVQHVVQSSYYFVIGIALAVWTLLGAVLLYFSRQRDAQLARRRAERRRPRPECALKLDGWQAMREKLIESEREFLRNGRMNTIDQLDRELDSPSTGSFDAALLSIPPTIQHTATEVESHNRYSN